MPAQILGQKKIERKFLNGASLCIVYTNWRGVTSQRYITPINGSLRWHEGDKFHPKPQWVIDAWDHDKRAIRTFTLLDIQKFEGVGAL
jgi:predicted DNA-binding transcriptional regulator YafY